jgi:hypothetical protein
MNSTSMQSHNFTTYKQSEVNKPVKDQKEPDAPSNIVDVFDKEKRSWRSVD